MSNLKQKLKNNNLTIGSWITIGHHSIIEIMSSAGFDWLTIDLEHSAIELTEAQNLIAHIQANGMEALVRVGKNEEVIIKRVLDAGANGIIVPMVNSKSDAIKAVRYVKYPPHGKRGVGLARAQKYGIGFEEYKKKLEDEIVIIAQVEHIDSVNNLEEILGVKGIDGVIIGPYDLSGSMGKPGRFNDDDVKTAIKGVESVCKKLNKPLGFHVIPPDNKELNKKILDGYTFLAFSLDFLFLGEKARLEMSNIKK
jgi:2-dehydro-3-deoxyglucarate aldolase